ncbi:hypothetical protein L798_12545 [Zootermopsis nevadensis]|uniref:Uncharacterized protein n=1 Tax=Zootermopsis nevadensis TaxID=136037 RepID=A0A067QTS1_ZOONE|nr:hypothetical protein L798_12545 [Zootermopsis nevadensis]
MKAAGPSHSCAQFLRQLYITEKSFFPGCNSMVSSSSLSSAMQPTRHDIFSFFHHFLVAEIFAPFCPSREYR